METMLRQVGISGALSALFVLLLLPACPASAFEAPAPFEVSEYSKDFHVSAGVAEERLETQQGGAAIVAELKLALGGDYAGVWFDNEKGEFVVPLLRGADRGAVAAKLSARGLSDYRTAPAGFSWEELEAVQTRVNESLHDLVGNGLTQTFLDSRANEVVIRQAQAANQVQQGTIASVAGRERGRVQVRPQDAEKLQIAPSACEFTPSLCNAPLRGGVGIWPNGSVYPWIPDYATCTVGFKALGNTSGNRFVLTAGHCAKAAGEWQSPPLSYTDPGYIGTVQEYVAAPASDYAKIKANGNYWDKSSWPVKVAYWGTNQEQTINYEAYSYIGQYVCHAGANSGASCGTVTALNLVSHQPGGDIFHRTEFQTICSKGGDSGGPVFTGDTALGIFTHNNIGVEGENPEYCHEKGYYTEITEATSAMGVTVGYRVGGAPFATSNAASNVQVAEATANGEVNPNSIETTYAFQYGKTTSYGSALPAPEGGAGHGTGPVGVNVTLPNLQPGTTYHYRLVAKNAAGTTYGADRQFTTPPAGPAATISSSGEIFATTVGGSLSLKGVTRLSNWAWQSPVSLAGSLSAYSKPASAMNASGTLFVLFQGPNHTLQEVRRLSNGSWQGPTQVGGPGAAYSAPAVAMDYKNNILHVVARGANNTLQQTMRYSDGSWHGPYEVGGPGAAYSAPAMVMDETNNILQVVARGANNTLQQTMRYSDWSWHGPYEVGGPGAAYSAPAMVFDKPNNILQVVAQGANNTLQQTMRYSDWSWHGPYEVGGPGAAYSAPAMVFDKPNNILQVVAQGANNTLQQTMRYSDWSWHGPYEVGGPGAAYSAPAMVMDSTNDLFVLAMGPNHKLMVTQRYGDWSWHGPFEVAGDGTAY